MTTLINSIHMIRNSLLRHLTGGDRLDKHTDLNSMTCLVTPVWFHYATMQYEMTHCSGFTPGCLVQCEQTKAA